MVHEAIMPLNICMPRIAKTSWSIMHTPITLATDGSDLMTDETMSFMPGWREMRRNGRSTRRMRSVLRGANTGKISASSTRYEMLTMIRSRMFHGFVMYDLGPPQKLKLMTLSSISTEKKKVQK